MLSTETSVNNADCTKMFPGIFSLYMRHAMLLLLY